MVSCFGIALTSPSNELWGLVFSFCCRTRILFTNTLQPFILCLSLTVLRMNLPCLTWYKVLPIFYVMDLWPLDYLLWKYYKASKRTSVLLGTSSLVFVKFRHSLVHNYDYQRSKERNDETFGILQLNRPE